MTGAASPCALPIGHQTRISQQASRQGATDLGEALPSTRIKAGAGITLRMKTEPLPPTSPSGSGLPDSAEKRTLPPRGQWAGTTHHDSGLPWGGPGLW